jgi:hypothetical protein
VLLRCSDCVAGDCCVKRQWKQSACTCDHGTSGDGNPRVTSGDYDSRYIHCCIGYHYPNKLIRSVLSSLKLQRQICHPMAYDQNRLSIVKATESLTLW